MNCKHKQVRIPISCNFETLILKSFFRIETSGDPEYEKENSRVKCCENMHTLGGYWYLQVTNAITRAHMEFGV